MFQQIAQLEACLLLGQQQPMPAPRTPPPSSEEEEERAGGRQAGREGVSSAGGGWAAAIDRGSPSPCLISWPRPPHAQPLLPPTHTPPPHSADPATMGCRARDGGLGTPLPANTLSSKTQHDATDKKNLLFELNEQHCYDPTITVAHALPASDQPMRLLLEYRKITMKQRSNSDSHRRLVPGALLALLLRGDQLAILHSTSDLPSADTPCALREVRTI